LYFSCWFFVHVITGHVVTKTNYLSYVLPNNNITTHSTAITELNIA